MTIRISGKNLDIGNALRSEVEGRVAAALAKYSDGQGSGHVTVARDGNGFRTECVLSIGGGMTLEASGLAPDAYASFDQSATRIETRLRRYKRRIKDRAGSPRTGDTADGAAAGSEESAYAVLEAPAEDDEGEADYHPVVIAETTKLLSRLSVSEAVIELDLTGVPALVFRHAGHGRVNVVYRRRDGTIGWVDPPASEA